MRNNCTNAKSELKQAWSLLQMDDLKCMKRVLRRLGYCNEHGIIDIKGKIACLLELVLTELLFDGVFVDMTVAHVCCYIELFCN